jgi:streptomycin 3"-adenylyltransferase
MGCFNPQRSDVDLLVVTRRRMPVDTKRRVAELLLRFWNDPCPIEISFLNESQLRPWRHPTPFDFHFGEDWREEFQQQMAGGRWRKWNDETRVDGDLAAHITVTLSRGTCLRGAPIGEVFPAVPRDDYVDSIVSDLEWAKARIAEIPVYFVLNACRVLAHLSEGLDLSKDEGGVWALAGLPVEFHRTIALALDIYRGDAEPGALRTEYLASFAAHVTNRAGARPAPTT